MKPETAAILQNAFKGLPSGPPTIEFWRGLTRLAKAYAEVTAPALTAATMDEFLANMPEPEPEHLPLMLAGITFLPGLVRKISIQTAANIRATIPPDRGGRPKALTTEEKKAVIAKIGKLHTQGVKLRFATLRASQELGVSIATARRVWSKRSSIMADGEAETITPELFLRQFLTDAREAMNAEDSAFPA
jgi:hypothetical protein